MDTYNTEPKAPFITHPKHPSDGIKFLSDSNEEQNKLQEAQCGKEYELRLSELEELLGEALRAMEERLGAKESWEEAKDKKEVRL